MTPQCLSRSSSCSLRALSVLFPRRGAVVSLCKSFCSSIDSGRPRSRFPDFSTYQIMDTSMRFSGSQFRLALKSRARSMKFRVALTNYEKFLRVSWSSRRIPWGVGGASLGLFMSFTASGLAHAEASKGRNDESVVSCSHGKKVYTDYSITGIPGDGRCLFRSVMHGACIRSGEPLPDERIQRELADDLRARIADEFIKRRAETEWFVEGNFDTYVSQIRKPHVWGGEPELFMASHVLQMPITVYMHDEDAGGIIAIAEYGQEYGKENPIRVLYHGFGHYDALQIPGRKASRSRL